MKKLLAILLFVIVLGVPAFFGIRFYLQQAKLKKDACDYANFYYQSIETPERISLDKLETMFEQHGKVVDKFLPESGGQNIAKILGIHHPVLNDPMQQTFGYRLSEEEAKRSEQLLRDLIRHSNKIILILEPYEGWHGPKATVLPTKGTRETLADAFSFSDCKMSIPNLTVFMDWPCRTVLLFPSGIKFFSFGRDDYFISTRGSVQRLEGAISQEFIDACEALRQDDGK